MNVLLALLLAGTTNAATVSNMVSSVSWWEAQSTGIVTLSSNYLTHTVVSVTEDQTVLVPYCALEIPTNAMTVVTNTVIVTTDNGKRLCSVCSGPGIDPGMVMHDCDQRGAYRSATERYETTTVTERKVLVLTWCGERRELVKETVLDVKVKTWRKKDQWEEVK